MWKVSHRVIALVALALVLTACGADGDSGLVGQWERAESSFTSLDGMIIEVQADGTEALIVTVPENEFQFVAGDVKWRSIESTGDGTYSFEDLVREEGTGATSYVEGIITVTDEGTLSMTFPTTGTVQEWVPADS